MPRAVELGEDLAHGGAADAELVRPASFSDGKRSPTPEAADQQIERVVEGALEDGIGFHQLLIRIFNP